MLNRINKLLAHQSIRGGFVEHLSMTSAVQQSGTKFIFVNQVFWSHFVVLLKLNKPDSEAGVCVAPKLGLSITKVLQN